MSASGRLCICMTGNDNDCSHSKCSPDQSPTTHSSQGQSTSCRTVPLDDLEDRILAQSEPVADFAIRLTFADQLENLGCKSIGFDALARPTTEHDAAQARSRDAGTHTLTQQIAFELRERRHLGRR